MAILSNKPDGWASFTPHQKLAWRREHETNSTGFIGVKAEVNGKFSASIYDPSQGKKIRLGTFATAPEAGAAYDLAFIGFYGPEDESTPEPDDDLGEIRELIRHPYPTQPPSMSPDYIAFIQNEIIPLLKENA